MNESNSLEQVKPQAPESINKTLDRMLPEFGKALQRTIEPEKFVRVALTAINKNEKLKRCTQTTILASLMDCAQLGLEPNGPLQEAYLIPYEDKRKGTVTCQLQIGYRGFAKLAHRSGKVAAIEANVVYERDQFEYMQGSDAWIKFKRTLEKDRGERVAVYCVVRMKDGSYALDIMPIHESYAIRNRSQAWRAFEQYKTEGPWNTDENEMHKKTCFKRLSKYLDLSPELHEAVQRDNEVEAEPLVVSPVFSGTAMNINRADLAAAQVEQVSDAEFNDLFPEGGDGEEVDRDQ